MFKQYISISIIVLLIHFSCSVIDIWGPKQLKQLYKTKASNYSVANFGVVPYGHTIIGTIKKSSPFNGCQEIKHFPTDSYDGALILMVMRGGCHFAEKVINAQRIGASLVIIVDNFVEDVHSIMPVERGKNVLNQV